jgi:hypothetical protein
MDPGSHVGFQISTKNTNLVEDHPVNISGKFGRFLFSGTENDNNFGYEKITILVDNIPLNSHDCIFFSVL